MGNPREVNRMNLIDLPKGVKLGTFDSVKLNHLWETVRRFPSTFADGTKNPESFAKRILAPDSIVLEFDGGIVLVEAIREGLSAEFHATFWDHKLSARKDLLKQCILWLFFTFNLERLETYVASYACAVRRFVSDKLGFVHEGTMRRAFRNHGELHNLEIYSILRMEALDG